jgi:hypothetical protein
MPSRAAERREAMTVTTGGAFERGRRHFVEQEDAGALERKIS